MVMPIIRRLRSFLLSYALGSMLLLLLLLLLLVVLLLLADTLFVMTPSKPKLNMKTTNQMHYAVSAVVLQQ